LPSITTYVLLQPPQMLLRYLQFLNRYNF
jgi:hypothetical protein